MKSRISNTVKEFLWLSTLFLGILLYFLIGLKNCNGLFINLVPCLIIGVMIIFGARKIKNVTRPSLFRMMIIVILACLNIYMLLSVYNLFSYATYYGTACIISSRIILFLSAYVINNLIFTSSNIERVFGIICSGMGIIMLMILPLRIVPDEAVHIYTAYYQSERILGNVSSTTDSFPVRNTDYDMLVDLIETQYNAEMAEAYYHRMYFDADERYEQTIPTELLVRNNDVAYILPSIGITAGKLLNLNGFYTLLLGRILNLIQYVILVYIAVRMIPFNKMIPAMVALLPMTLQQAMSYSYDSLIISASLLVVCISLKYLDKNIKPMKSELCLLTMFSLILIMLKLHAYIMIGLFSAFIYIYRKRDLNKYVKKVWIMIGVLIVLYLVISVLFYKLNPLSFIQEPLNPIKWADNVQGYTVAYFIKRPIEILMVFAKTIVFNGIYYWRSAISSYFGWLNITVSDLFVIGYTVILFLSAVPAKTAVRNINVDRSVKTYLLIGSIITIAGIVFGLVLSWTPVTSPLALGVQGRYFIPVFLLLLLLLQNKRICFNSAKDYELFGIYLCLSVLFLESFMPQIIL